ncbi:MAG: hypothetical protein DWI21_05840 [Planctomycetota bacterium]|nr:MAG: hypothetical protein DWI21_05840 [Planctomycetota bacterium]
MTDRSQFIHPIFIEISFHVLLVEAPIMGDIYLGLLVLAVLSAATFGIGRAIGRHVTPRTTNWLSVIAVAALMAYIACLWDKTSLVGLLPFSNLIVLGNWLPLEAGFLGGLASTQFAMPGWRRGLTVVGLQLAGVIVVLFPLMGVAPQCGNAWSEGICLQTTKQTCSAASAATLLKLHGIDTTEQEMAELCLTRRGTNWMGLYRGLKRKTADSEWEVEVFAGSADQLRLLNGPAILSVGLTQEALANRFYQTELGWRPGIRHSVVLLGFVTDLVDIGEPTPDSGRERWTNEDLQELYLGQGMRLVRRAR